MTAPNIVNVATITGKTAAQAVTTTATAIVTNSSGSGKVFKINAMYAANISGSSASLTVDFYRSSTAYKIGSTIGVPNNASIDVLSKAIYLEEGDSLRVTAAANTTLEVVCSYEEIY